MRTNPSGHRIVALACALAFGLAGTTALAQQDDIYEREQASSTDMTAADIRDKDLEAFLYASQQVQSIRSSYAEMMREAAPGERAELRENAVGDMTTAIQFSGIDVETYRAIGYLAGNDDELRRRLNAIAASM